MAVGVGLCFFACQRAPCGWFVGFFAGLILGSQLANLVGGQGQFAGLAFTSLLAVLTARKYATVAGFVGWGCGFFGRWALARFGERPCTRERSR
jgi:hypothetical protein